MGPGGAVHESHHELHAADGDELMRDAEVDRQEALAFEAVAAAGAEMAKEERAAMAEQAIQAEQEEVALLAEKAQAGEAEEGEEEEEAVAESALGDLIEQGEVSRA